MFGPLESDGPWFFRRGAEEVARWLGEVEGYEKKRKKKILAFTV